MPATVADPNRSLDSEQISPATIAHHTVYEKAPNLHQSHICQWEAQSYLVGPLSRLVGKPPLSPWVSTNVLPLTQDGNYTNSAISLKEIFDRISFYVCNSISFEVQIEKNGDRGTNVFTATLRPFLTRKFSTKFWGWRGRKFLGEKKRFLRGNVSANFPRPKFPQEKKARILPAEEIFKPKISWRQEEILRENLEIT